MAEQIHLPRGGRVWLRRLRPGDADALRRAFAELSEQSRYQRFFTGTPHLTDRMVEALMDVDHVDREALVAVSGETAGGLVGVIRYARDPLDATRADLAVTVADSWQGRGLATALLRRLSVLATRAGIRHFTVDMLADNTAVRSLVRSAGGVASGEEGEVVSAQIALHPGDDGAAELSAVLRAAASGATAVLCRDVLDGEPSLEVVRAVLLPETTALADSDRLGA